MLESQNEAMLRLVRKATDQGNVRDCLTTRAIRNVLGVEVDVRSSAGQGTRQRAKRRAKRFVLFRGRLHFAAEKFNI